MDTNIVLIMLYFLFNSTNDSNNNQIHTLTNYIKGMKIEPEYTSEKLKLVRKIAPLVPEEYATPVHKSLALSEKLIKFIEIMDVINEPINALRIEPIVVENNRDRVSKIMSIIQKDFPNPKMKSMGLVMDLLVNMEKYKKILSVIGGLSANTEGAKGGNNNMMKMMEAFVDDSDKKSMDGIKDMVKMMELMKVLDSPKKERPMEG